MSGGLNVVIHERAKDGGRQVLGLVPDPSPDQTRRTIQVFLVPQPTKLPALVMLGRITSNGRATVCDPRAKNGSEVPAGLLFREADNTTWTEMTGMYISGQFDPAEVTFAQGWTLDTATAALATVGIVVRKAPVVANCWTV